MWADPLSAFQVLVLPQQRYPEPRPLPDGFVFADQVPRSVERELLSLGHEHWRIPYERRFPGAREDSLIAIMKGDLIVSVSFVGADNQIRLPGYGEAQYMVIRPEFRGLGLASSRFTKVLERATEWGLAGVVLVTNRQGIPETFERWGSLRVGTIEPMGRRRSFMARWVNPHRWLARRAAAVLEAHGAPIPDEHGRRGLRASRFGH